MDILVFGSGSAAVFYIKDNKEYFENNSILAFADNNKQKQGEKCMGKEIISPQNIFKYNYDSILICSAYEEDIYKQLVYEIGILEEKIYTRRSFFEQIIFKWYDKKYDLYNRTILIVSEEDGTEEDYRKYYGRYYDLFSIVEVVSFNNINSIKNYTYDYILLTNFRPISFQNNHCVNNNCFENQLSKNDKNKLISMEVIQIYFNNIKKFRYDEKYDEKKFLIIRVNTYFMGLGSMVLTVARGIAYARKEGYIPVVDAKTLETQYLEEGEYGKINAYTKFFEQPDIYDIDDIKDDGNISIMYYVNYYSKKEESQIVLPKMKMELYNKYCEFKGKFNNKKVLGVLFRGTDYANLKPYGHKIQPDLNTMLQKVKEKISEWGGFDLIYLCTEVQEACECFENEFGKEKVCYYPQLRYKLNTKKYLAEIKLAKGEKTAQAKDYWIALNCLASCNSIIAGQSSGAKIALIMNNHKYENQYLFELGRYSIDDKQ